ncbi:MAG: DUF255 domain-containing protein [Planctomycetota bacterium]
MADLRWENFDPDAFDRARRENRPILLVLTKPWCTVCRALLDGPFRSDEVLQVARDRFVPIRVDAERRPDVNERYGLGEWPTVAYLTPDGELLKQHGRLEAAELQAELQSVADYFAGNQGEIEERLQSLWASQEAGEEIRRQRQGELNKQIIEDIRQALYSGFDHKYGGWGDKEKFPHPEAIDFALILFQKQNDPQMREVAQLTLDKTIEGAVHDSIDGGFFRYSKTPDWRRPNFEKLLDSNALKLRNLLEAGQIFDQPHYHSAARGIVSWMTGRMMDPDSGAFFGSQDADPDYYLGDRAAREDREPPHIDKTIYTDSNAITISALLKAAVVLDQPELRTVAHRALDFLLRELVDESQGVFHYWDGTYHLPGLLSDQAYLIRALIDMAQHTGNSDLLLPAERIAEQAIARQRAPGGGFFDILHDPSNRGSMKRRNRSILENSVMAESLLRLSSLARRPEFHDEAVSTLAAFTGDYREYGHFVAAYGRAVDLLFYEPLMITVVGDRETEEADALRRTALQPYVPSRIVQMLDPKHDPILLERAKFEVEDAPVAYLELGREIRATARSERELLEAIAGLEEARR